MRHSQATHVRSASGTDMLDYIHRYVNSYERWRPSSESRDNTSFLDDRQDNGEAPARTTDLKVPPRQQPRTAPRRQTPAEAPPPSKFTVLLEPDAAADFDQLALDIHRLLGAGFPGY